MKKNFPVVDKSASLRDEVSYYWKVLASDVDGGTTLMGTTTAASGKARILGYAKDRKSDPVESVDISARMIGTSTETVTSSEEDGFFELKDLAGGRYLLKAVKEFYRRYRDTLELGDEETKNVELTMKKLDTDEEGQKISPQKNFVTVPPHLNLPHQGGGIQGNNEYSPPLVGGARGGGELLRKGFIANGKKAIST